MAGLAGETNDDYPYGLGFGISVSLAIEGLRAVRKTRKGDLHRLFLLKEMTDG